MIRRIAFIVLLLVGVPAALYAQTCSGPVSGVWTCPSGTTSATVNATISAAAGTDIIQFATGTYNFTAPMPCLLTKGCTLICQTQPCTITGPAPNPYTFGIPTWSGSGNFFTNTYRISGFTWAAPMPTGTCLVSWGSSPNPVNEGTFTSIRIDSNIATADSTVADPNMFCMQTPGHRSYFYGVIDHNTFNCARSCRLLNGTGTTVDPFPPPNPLGTGNNLFLEDNTVTITLMTNNGTGVIDNGGTSVVPLVVRHNTFLDGLVTGHYTPLNYEFYNNSTSVDANATLGNQDCFRCFHSQANSAGMYFNNSFNSNLAPNSDVLEVQSNIRDGYRVDPRQFPFTPTCTGFINHPPVADGNRPTSQGNQGYPCFMAATRDNATRAFSPFYAWNNQKNGILAKLFVSDPGSGQIPDFQPFHMKVNRDYFNTVSSSPQSTPTSPWDCATGTDMGFGPLAQRPTDCASYTGEVGGGLGYAAHTTSGTIGATTSGCGTASDDVLYKFTASGWTQAYTPYVYCHPLVSGTALTAFPSVNVTPGAYLTAQTVTVSDSSPSPTLFCTTDGTSPTHSSPSFTSPHAFTVSSTETINCLAASGSLLDSLTLTAPYQINMTAFTPLMDPPPGGFQAGLRTVQIKNLGLLTKHCLTVDGSTPTSSGLGDGNCGHVSSLPACPTTPVCGAANTTNQFSSITFNSTITIKVLDTGVGLNDSPITSATYTVGTGTNGLWWEDIGGPNITIGGVATSENFGNQAVGTTSGILPIYFNNPGTTATTITAVTLSGTGFARVSNDGCGAVPITIAGGSGVGGFCTIGITFTPLTNGLSTGTLTLTDNAPGSPHVINLSGTGTGSPAPAATPTFSLANGTYLAAQPVSISTTSTGAIICYNTTGASIVIGGSSSCPAGSTLYTGPLTVSVTEKIFAVAGGLGFTDSPVGVGQYAIGPTQIYPQIFAGDFIIDGTAVLE